MQIPLYVYKSTMDDVSVVADTDALVSKYCAGGATIRYVRDNFGNHLGELSAGQPGAINYVLGVFNGSFVQTPGCRTQQCEFWMGRRLVRGWLTCGRLAVLWVHGVGGCERVRWWTWRGIGEGFVWHWGSRLFGCIRIQPGQIRFVEQMQAMAVYHVKVSVTEDCVRTSALAHSQATS